jgi:hypothetical protein
MKLFHLSLSLIIVCLLLSAAACGSSEPIIETPAKELNLSADDLGSGWSLTQDVGLDGMPEMQQSHILDANMRMFGVEETMGMAMSIILSTKTVSSAEQEMKGATVQSFIDDIQSQVPGASLETLDPPDIGDEAAMVGGGHPDMGLNIYLVTFRKTNIIVLFTLIGSSESTTEESALGYARQMEAKIQ